MATLTLDVQDSFLQDFLTLVEHYKDKIQLTRDENLMQDPYFYERQKQLQKDLEEVENGTAEMISHEELWHNIHVHLDTLRK